MKKTNWIAIVAMIFLCGMISFVTNLAAPVGNIWKFLYDPSIPEGSNTAGMLGNMMNFAAYLVMGVPSGMLLTRIGYKKTALVAIATGFAGVGIQFLSGKFAMPAGFAVYLAGAFVAGLSMCLLNVVTNPMLNTLGGGGKRGNQLNMLGMTFNSVLGTITPMLVGWKIGQITSETKMADVNLVLFIALGVFAATFAVLSFLKIEDPEAIKTTEKIGVFEPLKFRHTLFGVIGIFCYVGVEVGIPATLMLWLSSLSGDAAWAGKMAGYYWAMTIIGRAACSALGAKISARAMLSTAMGIGIVLVVAGMATGNPWCFILCGLCTAPGFPSTYNLAVEKLGKYTNAASGLFMTMIVGGGILPLLQGAIADRAGYTTAFAVSIAGFLYLFSYAAFLSTPKASN